MIYPRAVDLLGGIFAVSLFFDCQCYAFALYGIVGLEWAAPVATEDTEKTLNALREIAETQ